MRQLAVIAGLSMVVGAPAAALWDNGLPAGNNALSSQLDTVYPFNSQTADDVIFGFDVVIPGLTWYGTWWNPGPPGNATVFNIFIYADAGGHPTGAGLPDPSATALKHWTIPFANAHETPYAPVPGYYKYDAWLSYDPFTFLAGHRYWIAVQTVNTFPPQWGWASTGATQGTATQGFQLLGTPYWTPQNTEVAFQIDMPEPAAALLFGVVAVRLRRR